MSELRGVILDAGSLGLEDLQWGALRDSFSKLDIHDFTQPADVLERIADTDIVMVNKTQLTASHFHQAPQLKQIIVLATGTNNIDLAAAKNASIPVCNNRGYSTHSLVEHTLTLILALARNLPNYMHKVSAGDWEKSQQFCILQPTVQGLHGATLGIIGLGSSGSALAAIANTLGMKVIAMQSSQGNSDSAISRLPLAELVQQADVVSLHCPLTEITRGLIDKAILRKMKPNALLVNTARGGIVVEDDLVEALNNGWIAGAAVDVLSTEPPTQGNPLLSCMHPNLIITPHNAWGSVSARQALINQTTEIVQQFRQGKVMNCVNP